MKSAKCVSNFFSSPLPLKNKKVFVHRLEDKIFVLLWDFFFFFLDSQMFSSANKKLFRCVAERLWRKEKASTSNHGFACLKNLFS